MKDDRKLKNKKKLKVTKKGCFGAFAALSLGYFFKTASDFFYTKDLACSLILKTAEGVKKEDILDAISYANQIGRLDLISVLLGFLGIILGFGAVFGFLGIKESSENIAKNTAETWIKKNAKGIVDETIDEAVNIVKNAAETWIKKNVKGIIDEMIDEVVRGNKIVEKAEKEVKNSKNTDVQNKEEYKNL